jgi:hypothetical protein
MWFVNLRLANFMVKAIAEYKKSACDIYQFHFQIHITATRLQSTSATEKKKINPTQQIAMEKYIENICRVAWLPFKNDTPQFKFLLNFTSASLQYPPHEQSIVTNLGTTQTRR